MTATIFIDGEAGTTGLQIRDKLADVPTASRCAACRPMQRKDQAAKLRLFAEVDVVILCLPDEAAKETAALIDGLGDHAPRVIDASSAHRVAPGWTYGFPELIAGQGQAIARARKVTNPGCHATGAIALLRPLTAAGLIAKDAPITIGSVSGYSGGGKAMIEAYESGRAPRLRALRARPRAQAHAGNRGLFRPRPRARCSCPSVGNFRQGMLVSVPLQLDALAGKPSGADLRAALAEHYRGQRYVSVASAEESAKALRLEPESLNGTNELHIHVYANEARRQAVLVAKLDNLGKGASGAAVQNLALMLGL